MNKSTVCPHCKGEKGWLVAIKASARWLLCQTCYGDGVISEEVAGRYARGQQMREQRLDRGMTLRAEAARLGISPTELSQREQGVE